MRELLKLGEKEFRFVLKEKIGFKEKTDNIESSEDLRELRWNLQLAW